MHAFDLAHITDTELLSDLATLVADDRRTTAALLAHIGEVDARGLFLPAACSSMHVYCVRVLRLAEEVAYKGIRVARIARRFPQIFAAIAEGRLHVSGVAILAPHLNDENVDDVLAAAVHRSKAELELIVAGLAPQPDLPTAITPADPTGGPGEVQLDLDPVAPPHSRPAASPPAKVKPLTPERFGLQVTISKATHEKLERAKALMRHRNPSGDVAEVLDRALDALLAKLEKEKFGETARPRARRARSEGADARYVPSEDRRAVHARDGEQCSFVSETGERCTERGFLEIDHVDPVALGGESTAKNARLLCHAHNQYEAERKLGADFMGKKRAEAESQRSASSNNVQSSVTSKAATAQIEADVSSALRGMGFTAAQTRQAMAASVATTAAASAATFEQRIRAALAELSRSRGMRCSEGPFDLYRAA